MVLLRFIYEEQPSPDVCVGVMLLLCDVCFCGNCMIVRPQLVGVGVNDEDEGLKN